MISLSVVVPCYNEAGNIPLIVGRFREVLGNRTDVEVLLVNNGSKDHSESVFKEVLGQLQDSRIRVVNVEVNKGYGFGIMSGLHEAQGAVLAWTHADMQTDPLDVLKAFELFQSGQDENLFVKGKRRNRAFAEQFFTWGMQMIASFALGKLLDDVNAQPKLFSRKFYQQYLLKHAPDDFSLDLFALYMAHQYGRVQVFPVYFNKRIHGEAKGGGSFKTRIKLIKRTWAYIFVLKQQLKTDSLR